MRVGMIDSGLVVESVVVLALVAFPFTSVLVVLNLVVILMVLAHISDDGVVSEFSVTDLMV